MDLNKLSISTAPHIHRNTYVRKSMAIVVIALLPAFAAAVWQFGVSAAIVTAVSVCSCVLFEWLGCKYLLKKPCTLGDGSAIVTGLLLAFNLPSSMPLYQIVTGAAVAIGLGKLVFGGIGNNPFNPALVGRVFMLVSFPTRMTSWSAVGQMLAYTDATTCATPLYYVKGMVQGYGVNMSDLPTFWDMFWGRMPGCIGEISAIALIAGLVILLVTRTITWHIPVSILATVAVIATALHFASPDLFIAPQYHLMCGGLLLGSCFMATDYTTSPMTHKGMVIYGICIGFITMVIRLFGSYPEGMSFAILIMNAFVPLINRGCRSRHFSKI